MLSELCLVLVLVIIYLVWRRGSTTDNTPAPSTAESFIPKWGARSLSGAIPPVCISCSEVLPTERHKRCESNPAMCAYPGLTSAGSIASVKSIADGFIKSIESFCGLPCDQKQTFCGLPCDQKQTFIDAPDPAFMRSKDRLLSASIAGY